MTDSRHRQLSRIYQRPLEDDEAARSAINAGPGVLASALFMEAVESDDVISPAGARQYLEDRLRFLGDLVTAAQYDISDTFEASLRAWD